MASAEMSCKDTKQHYRSVETESRQQHGGAQCNQIASVHLLLLLPLLSFSLFLSFWLTWMIFSLTKAIFSTPSPISAQKKVPLSEEKKIYLKRTNRVMWLPVPWGPWRSSRRGFMRKWVSGVLSVHADYVSPSSSADLFKIWFYQPQWQAEPRC